VLNELVAILRSLRPDARIVVGAGASADSIQQRFGESVIADRFIPQRALLPQVEVVFHHGGVSSFTESLYAAKPMIVMPFSSDQFNVAKDVERQRLGAVLDPNHLTAERVAAALEVASGPDVQEAVERWSSVVKSRGPAYAARDIQYPGDDHGSR
jgi:UDP:flavonoid glycosyltransferase YjiC (YdhE family)